MDWFNLIIKTVTSTYILFLDEDIEWDKDIKPFFFIGFGVSTIFIVVSLAFFGESDITHGLFPHSARDRFLLHNCNFNDNYSINKTLDLIIPLIEKTYTQNYTWIFDPYNPDLLSTKVHYSITFEEEDTKYRDYLLKPVFLDSNSSVKTLNKTDFFKYILIGTCFTLYALACIWNDHPF